MTTPTVSLADLSISGITDGGSSSRVMQSLTLISSKPPRPPNFENGMHLITNIIFFDIFLAFTWPLWWVLDIVNLIAVTLRLKERENDTEDLSISHIWFLVIVSFVLTTLWLVLFGL